MFSLSRGLRAVGMGWGGYMVRGETGGDNKSLKLGLIRMQVTKACQLLTVVPVEKKTVRSLLLQISSACVWSGAQWRRLRACQLQRSAQSAYCLACRCPCSHAAPSAAPYRRGSERAGLGGAKGCSPSSARRRFGRFGPVLEMERRGPKCHLVSCQLLQ